MKNLFVVIVCFLELAILFSVSSAAPGMSALNNYTADMVTTTERDTFTSKTYYKEGKQRTEGQKSSITIMRFDKKLGWMLMPQKNTYMEISVDTQKPEIQNIMAGMGNLKTEKEFVGIDTVDGHPCKKYHLFIITDGKKEKSGYTWEASDLNNFPVKYQSEDNKWSTVWKNIKKDAVSSDALFEIPAGYTKMDMPVFGSGKPKLPQK